MKWFDAERFAEFCGKHDLVPEKYLSFYIRWIKRFLQLSSSRGISAVPGAGTGSDEDRLLFFMEHLRADLSVEDWQVEQARRAVELYLNVFLAKGGSGRIAGGSPALPAVADEPSAVQGRQDAGGTNIREVQELLGHKNVETTMIHTHVVRDGQPATKPAGFVVGKRGRLWPVGLRFEGGWDRPWRSICYIAYDIK